MCNLNVGSKSWCIMMMANMTTNWPIVFPFAKLRELIRCVVAKTRRLSVVLNVEYYGRDVCVHINGPL